jgi:hypothetical protein
MKKSNDTIGNRTHDLPACSAVPQPTAQLRAPTKQLRNTGIINSITWSDLVGYFYMICITMHRSMNIKAVVFYWVCGLYIALYNTTVYPLQRPSFPVLLHTVLNFAVLLRMCSVTYSSLKCLCIGGSKFMSGFLYQMWITGNMIPHDLPQPLQWTLIFLLHIDKNLIINFPVQYIQIVSAL